MPSSRTKSPQSDASASGISARTALAQHPLCRRNYRVATAAIEEMVDLTLHCLSVLIPGALIYARPRMGKTHAIDYLALHLALHRPDVLVLRMSCEHHRTDHEGPFFASLLGAAGVAQPLPRSTSDKRFALLRQISGRLQQRDGFVVILFCDEAQRLSKHGLEWLRDLHDQLAQHGFRLITFLVGQPQLMQQRAQYQASGDEQIVARFMIEHMAFRGIASPEDAATCMAGYDLTRYPDTHGPTFTGYFYPQAWHAGFRLEHCAAALWNAFVRAHAASQLTGAVEIAMDYFTRAIETVLLQGPQWDRLGLELDEACWERAVRQSGYVAAQTTVQRPGGY